MATRQWDETDRQNLPDLHALVVEFVHQQKMLHGESFPHGHHQLAPGAQLRHQRWRDVINRRGHDDGVEGSFLGPTVVAIAKLDLDVAVIQPRERAAR